MNAQEAEDLLVAEGTQVVIQGVIHPGDFSLLEWAEIVAKAVARRPELLRQMEGDLYVLGVDFDAKGDLGNA